MSTSDNTLDKLVGTWRLVSMVAEFQDTGEKTPVAWDGRFIITQDGAYLLIMTMKGRTAPVTQEDRATALGTMYAESGKVTAEGARVRIAVDLAAHPQLAGVVLYRAIEYYDDRMRSTTEWAPSVIRGGRVSRSITEWQRE